MHVGQRDIWLSLLLFGLTLAVFGQTCWHGFTNWDDPDYVFENRRVVSGVSSENARWAFTSFHAGNWHPLTWLSLQLDAQLLGTAPWGFHLTNVLLHAANTVLLFWVLRSLSGDIGPSTIVAFFYAFHPLHVESVAWIAERKDVLGAFFWMLTCLAYAWYARRPGWMKYVLTLTFFIAGLSSKPMLVTLPFVLLLLDYWPLDRFFRFRDRRGEESLNPAQGTYVPRSAPLTTHDSPLTTPHHPTTSPPHHLTMVAWLLLEKVPFFVLAASSCAITLYAQQHGGAIRSLEQCPFKMRVGNALVTYCAYIGQTLWPTNLGMFYPHPSVLLAQNLSSGITSWQVAGAAVALTLVTVFVCVKGRSFPYLLVGWLWYLGTLVPVIGLVQVGEAGRADRYTYIPLIGLFIAAAWGIRDLGRRWRAQKVAAGLAMALLLAGILLTHRQLRYWRSESALWEHTLEACGDSTAAHTQLGIALLKLNSSEEAERYFRLKLNKFEEAEEHFRHTLRLDPNDPYALHDLGTALIGQGRIGDAVKQYREAVSEYPHFDRPHYSLGMALADLGQRREAIYELEEALHLNPGFAAAHRRLGLLFAAEGSREEAADHLRAAIEGGLIDPSIYYELARVLALQRKFEKAIETLNRALAIEPGDWRLHSLLGLARYESGDHEAAVKEYDEASRLKPGWPENLARLAWVLATHPDPKGRNGKQAVQLAQQACHATANRNPLFLDALAAAYAEAGDFSLAVETAKQALAKASAEAKTDLAQEIKDRLKLYEQGRSFRTTGAQTRQ
jgi:Flp pilus assembly protein TadD